MLSAPDKIRELYLGGRFAEAVDFVRSVCADTVTRRGEEWRSIVNAAFNLSDLMTARLAALRWRIEDPEGFEPLQLAAQACLRAGDEAHAKNSIDILVQSYADRPSAWFTAGIVRGELGNFEQAEYELKRAYSLDPTFIGVWNAISRFKTFRPGDVDIDFVTNLPSRVQGLPLMAQASAHYAAATVLEQIGEFDAAFGGFIEGAAFRRAELKHDMDRVLGLMRNAVDAFEAEIFDRFRGAGAKSGSAIFVIGPPRSGAALVERILASHPRVHGAGETGLVRMTTWPLGDLRPLFVNDVVKMADRRPWLGLGENFETFSRELCGDHLYTVFRGPDQMAFAGVIRLMLPFAKIIFVDRDPLEAAWSAFKLNYQGIHSWSYDFEEIALWRETYEMTRSAWRERIGGETLDVSYEALAVDPQRETKRILKFVGLAPNPACDHFYEVQRAAPIESARRLRSPIDSSSIVQSSAYGSRLDPLRRALESRGLMSAPSARLH